MKSLPETFRERIENIVIRVAESPNRRQSRSPEPKGHETSLYGLYEGVPADGAPRRRQLPAPGPDHHLQAGDRARPQVPGRDGEVHPGDRPPRARPLLRPGRLAARPAGLRLNGTLEDQIAPRRLRRLRAGPLRPVHDGAFSLYRLEKWDIGTLEALGSLAKSWNLSRAQISFGGLKDRHARTDQVLSIRGGPRAELRGLGLPGRVPRPLARSDQPRELPRKPLPDHGARPGELPDLAPLKKYGVPNYFDDQRFGSLRGTNGEFIGHALVRGENEKALKLALASPSGEDRKKERDLKVLLRDRWGDWAGLSKDLPPVPCPQRRLVPRGASRRVRLRVRAPGAEPADPLCFRLPELALEPDAGRAHPQAPRHLRGGLRRRGTRILPDPVPDRPGPPGGAGRPAHHPVREVRGRARRDHRGPAAGGQGRAAPLPAQEAGEDLLRQGAAGRHHRPAAVSSGRAGTTSSTGGAAR